MRTPYRLSSALALAATLIGARSASATVIPVGIGAFGGSTLLTFAGLADGTEVNGLTVDGIQFVYSLGNGQVIVDGGPGNTNNIAPPNIVSIGNSSGVLRLTLPAFVDTFGYGYAILAATAVPNATTISLFNGATALGSLSYAGVVDPIFTGGFAGIQSTDPFNRVDITFNSLAAPAFALDNIRTLTTGTAAVPEPTTLVLFGTGVLGIVGARARRRSPSPDAPVRIRGL